MNTKQKIKTKFYKALLEFVKSLDSFVSTKDKQWTIKGFIDIYRNIYTISTDTKIISKILEIHLFPQLLKFAEENRFKVVLASHQNYYPDISLVSQEDEKIKFAIDFKTTYRLEKNPEYCNGFTLGSHGKYFVDRTSKKNIQYPYSEYFGHYCLGIIYTRVAISSIGETKTCKLDELQSIASVIKDFKFFVVEKWRIASDKEAAETLLI